MAEIIANQGPTIVNVAFHYYGGENICFTPLHLQSVQRAFSNKMIATVPGRPNTITIAYTQDLKKEFTTIWIHSP